MNSTQMGLYLSPLPLSPTMCPGLATFSFETFAEYSEPENRVQDGAADDTGPVCRAFLSHREQRCEDRHQRAHRGRESSMREPSAFDPKSRASVLRSAVTREWAVASYEV